MEIEGFRWLLSVAGQQLLAELNADAELNEANFLRYTTKLRKHYPAAAVTAALETSLLRRASQAKFPQASQLYFTREALEQATPWLVANYRQRHFAAGSHLADLGCSIGGDALALAQSCHVLALDRDPLRLAMLAANAQALGLSNNIAIQEADFTSLEFAGYDGLFIDPARRSNGKRIWDVEHYQPPLSTLERWRSQVPIHGAKVAPGIPDDAVPAGYDLEFISLDGDLREASLWWHAGQSGGQRKAVVLTSAGSEHSIIANPEQAAAALSEPCRYLYEPDPAVIRAHAVADLAAQHNLAQFDASIAYLTSDSMVQSPLLRVWQIEQWLPFNLKALRHVLHEREIGRVTVKKRGSPITPEELSKQLRLKGRNEQTVVLTKLQGQPIVLLVKLR
ncbi:class I SAM-dependent methyltransferase [Herpetosiphon geysericola]|uniref:THUMP-like domain-containing protein n=1 Tax=Herpetosiphon geysericola TaxID=70996 RepID=A0A0P6XEB4_9CHLR|nr:class I SAM-dependent methyltransferase [Herpetosiphon geysericola]KPL81395.1 hypothetical protein SE18_22380 [Herpetosiphon geysericola]